ncbi:MAG: TasA family protein, partial [Chloroflexota bacterium]|nr:TasA family protein [Chloroflexota bacterium]
MKKILMSLMIIAVAAGLIAGGTMAYFSDTETSEDNVFASGVIDMEIAEPSSFTLEDMKPCDWEYRTITLTKKSEYNEGPVYVHFDVGDGYDVICSEPEDAIDGGCAAINDIENWITVDLTVDG